MNKKIKAKKWFVLLGFISILFLPGCESYSDGTQTWLRSDIDEVKNSYFLHFDMGGKSIGKAFDSWFDSPSWTSHQTFYKKGEVVVRFEGKIKGSGQEVVVLHTCCFNPERRFRVCEYSGMLIDDRPQGFDDFETLMKRISRDLSNKN